MSCLYASGLIAGLKNTMWNSFVAHWPLLLEVNVFKGITVGSAKLAYIKTSHIFWFWLKLGLAFFLIFFPSPHLLLNCVRHIREGWKWMWLLSACGCLVVFPFWLLQAWNRAVASYQALQSGFAEHNSVRKKWLPCVFFSGTVELTKQEKMRNRACEVVSWVI